MMLQEFDLVFSVVEPAGEAIATGFRESELTLAVVERELVRASVRTGAVC